MEHVLYRSELCDTWKYAGIIYEYNYTILGWYGDNSAYAEAYVNLDYLDREQAWAVIDPDEPYDHDDNLHWIEDYGYFGSQKDQMDANLDEVTSIIKSKLDKEHEELMTLISRYCKAKLEKFKKEAKNEAMRYKKELKGLESETT